MKQELNLSESNEGCVWLHKWFGRIIAPHHHDELEMNLVVCGTADYLLGSRRYELARNSQIWLFPEQDHVLVNQSRDFTMWILVIRPAVLERICITNRSATLKAANPTGSFCRILGEGASRRLADLMQEIANNEPLSMERYNAGLSYALLSCWDAFHASQTGAPGASVHPAVDNAVRLIRDEAEPFTLYELARQGNVSVPWLSYLFHQQIGMPITRFRNKQRIIRFMRFVEASAWRNMSEAALEAGFGSYAQFYRVFQQEMEMSPGQYRQRMRSDRA